MIFPLEFYYAVISAIIGILWTNKLNFDSEGRLHFEGRYVGYYLGFLIWLLFFGITYFIVAEITKPLINFIVDLTGTGVLYYIKDVFLILFAFIVFYIIYTIKIKCKTKEGIKPEKVVEKPVKAVKKLPKKIKKINKPTKRSKKKIRKKKK